MEGRKRKRKRRGRANGKSRGWMKHGRRNLDLLGLMQEIDQEGLRAILRSCELDLGAVVGRRALQAHFLASSRMRSGSWRRIVKRKKRGRRRRGGSHSRLVPAQPHLLF